MNGKLTQFDIARIISASVQAAIGQLAGVTPEQARMVAKAIGGNAGQVVYMEIQERGIVVDEA